MLPEVCKTVCLSVCLSVCPSVRYNWQATPSYPDFNFSYFTDQYLTFLLVMTSLNKQANTQITCKNNFNCVQNPVLHTLSEILIAQSIGTHMHACAHTHKHTYTNTCTHTHTHTFSFSGKGFFSSLSVLRLTQSTVSRGKKFCSFNFMWALWQCYIFFLFFLI